VLFDALALRYRGGATAAHEGLEQRALAHARIAGDPHELALAGLRALPALAQLRERIASADEAVGNVGGGARRTRAGRNRHRRCRAAGRGADETVSEPRRGLYESRARCVIGERGAYLADGGLEHGFAHVLVSPHRVEQRVLGDQRPGLARERAQHAECLGWQGDRFSVALQACIGLVQFERIETQAQRG
jgi:hypothetical protein